MIDIILLTANRIKLLQQIIAGFEERLKTPYRLIIVNNGSNDGTSEYLRLLTNKNGYPMVIINNSESAVCGICDAYTQAFKWVTSDVFITTQDDLLIPQLEPDVLIQLINLFNRNPDYGAICLRTNDQKRHPKGDDELIRKVSACPGVFRIQRRLDIEKTGGFGHAKRWEDSEMVRIMANIGKRCGIASNLWVKDLGLAPDRGYPDWYRKNVVGNYNRNFEWVAQDRRQRKVSDVDLKTHEPIN